MSFFYILAGKFPVCRIIIRDSCSPLVWRSKNNDLSCIIQQQVHHSADRAKLILRRTLLITKNHVHLQRHSFFAHVRFQLFWRRVGLTELLCVTFLCNEYLTLLLGLATWSGDGDSLPRHSTRINRRWASFQMRNLRTTQWFMCPTVSCLHQSQRARSFPRQRRGPARSPLFKR